MFSLQSLLFWLLSWWPLFCAVCAQNETTSWYGIKLIFHTIYYNFVYTVSRILRKNTWFQLKMNVVHQSRRNHQSMKSNRISKNSLNQAREKITLKSRMYLSQGSSQQMPILAMKNCPCLLREKGLNISDSMNHFLRHMHPNLKVHSIKIMLMLVQMRVNQRIMLLVQCLSIIIIVNWIDLKISFMFVCTIDLVTAFCTHKIYNYNCTS